VAGALLRQRVENEARVVRGDFSRLLAMAAAGAVVGPVALAWGLQRREDLQTDGPSLDAHVLRQRLQNMSSNSTSRSNTAPRSMPDTPRKRILSAYLLALISGTQERLRASVRRSSWATLVVVSMS